jgi:hypothetical protein
MYKQRTFTKVIKSNIKNAKQWQSTWIYLQMKFVKKILKTLLKHYGKGLFLKLFEILLSNNVLLISSLPKILLAIFIKFCNYKKNSATKVILGPIL